MTKKTVFAFLVLALLAGAANAQQLPTGPVAVQDKTQPSPRLNPVQLRAVNAEKVAKMAAIERKNAGNPRLIDEQCNGVCKESDQELQSFLSNDQYSSYFGSRANYYKYDKDFASQSASILLTNSVQNPAPARANDATIAPTKPKPINRPAGNLGRNAR